LELTLDDALSFLVALRSSFCWSFDSKLDEREPDDSDEICEGLFDLIELTPSSAFFLILAS